MDWLRIGAFAFLIFYHIGMVFVPWAYHVKTSEPSAWVAVPMLALSPWRLMLLFLISGYATRALLARRPDGVALAGNRSVRLLLPLAFGVVVLVPPQAWVELVTQRGYGESFLTFWIVDFWRFGKLGGITLPNWNHLWFVGYLWIYTIALLLFAALPGTAWLQRGFDLVFGGTRALWLPIAWLVTTQVLVFTRWTDTHDVIGDGVAHLAFFPAFLFGFGLAGAPRVIGWLRRLWLPSLLIGIGAYAVAIAIEISFTAATLSKDMGRVMMVTRQVQCWATIAALIGIADRFLNRDHRWRSTLTEGVFPFYLIHQTLIVVGMFGLLQLGLPAVVEFIALIAITASGCWLFYAAGREIGWLRPLIGLKPVVARAEASARKIATA